MIKPDEVTQFNISGLSLSSPRTSFGVVKPEAPAGLFALPPSPPPSNYPFKFGKFIRERSNNFSAAIAKKLDSLDDARAEAEPEPAASTVIKPDGVTQFNISGLSLSLLQIFLHKQAQSTSRKLPSVSARKRTTKLILKKKKEID